MMHHTSSISLMHNIATETCRLNLLATNTQEVMETKLCHFLKFAIFLIMIVMRLGIPQGEKAVHKNFTCRKFITKVHIRAATWLKLLKFDLHNTIPINYLIRSIQRSLVITATSQEHTPSWSFWVRLSAVLAPGSRFDDLKFNFV